MTEIPKLALKPRAFWEWSTRVKTSSTWKKHFSGILRPVGMEAWNHKVGDRVCCLQWRGELPGIYIFFVFLLCFIFFVFFIYRGRQFLSENIKISLSEYSRSIFTIILLVLKVYTLETFLNFQPLWNTCFSFCFYLQTLGFFLLIMFSVNRHSCSCYRSTLFILCTLILAFRCS